MKEVIAIYGGMTVIALVVVYLISLIPKEPQPPPGSRLQYG